MPLEDFDDPLQGAADFPFGYVGDVDVVVVHSNLLHATPVHTGTRPRFLAIRHMDSVAVAEDAVSTG